MFTAKLQTSTTQCHQLKPGIYIIFRKQCNCLTFLYNICNITRRKLQKTLKIWFACIKSLKLYYDRVGWQQYITPQMTTKR
jgi:hypothetical protein